MRLLLDTHVAIWVWLDPARIPNALKQSLETAAESAMVSVATYWEIAIKQANGKLKLPGPAKEWIPGAMANFRFAELGIDGRHALAAGALPRVHGDPFDRMLIAQAQIEGLTLVTVDPVFRQYSVKLHVI